MLCCGPGQRTCRGQSRRITARWSSWAPWLEPGDRELLLTYCQAWETYRTAGRELDTRLADPRFADPTSPVAKEGVIYSRLVHRNANLVMQMANALGFSPAARARLRLEVKPPEPDPNSPGARCGWRRNPGPTNPLEAHLPGPSSRAIRRRGRGKGAR